MDFDPQQLQQLLESPTESLGIELKSWLDLSDYGPRGTLAKGLIALANHGGGLAVLGFDTEGVPAGNRPDTLAAYSQDAVNDIVDRYADPGFHCSVSHVTRPTDGLAYPVIVVPGGHKVPIRSRRGTQNNEIIADRYYTRRPGPASEPPQSGHEWDELIRRCVRNNTDEIASLVRDVLEGRAPHADAQPDAAALLEQWYAASLARWTELTGRLPPDSYARMPLGHFSISCLVEGVSLDLRGLREAMRRADQHLTGWPPWWSPTREGLAPYVHEDTIECHMAPLAAFPDAGHADFWRASTNGHLFLIRGYVEDALEQDRRAIPPGTVFDLTLPVWRVGECLLYIQRFATEAGAADSVVTVCCKWTGLQGRRLTAIDGRRWLFDTYIARSDSHTATITTPVERISGALPEIVRELVDPIYTLFQFFQPPAELYSEETTRMLRREL